MSTMTIERKNRWYEYDKTAVDRACIYIDCYNGSSSGDDSTLGSSIRLRPQSVSRHLVPIHSASRDRQSSSQAIIRTYQLLRSDADDPLRK